MQPPKGWREKASERGRRAHAENRAWPAAGYPGSRAGGGGRRWARCRPATSVLSVSRTARGALNVKNKARVRAASVSGEAPSPAGLGGGRAEQSRPACLRARGPGLGRSSIICQALPELFSLNTVSVQRAGPTWVSVLGSVPVV